MDKTVTQRTGRTAEPDENPDNIPCLILLLECDRPRGGSDLVALDGIQSVTIGRGDERAIRTIDGPSGRVVAITIPDRRVSSKHVVIERTSQGFRVKDLGSANGTRLRGEAVEQSLLHPGDILQIGHSLLAYDEKPLERRGVIRVGDKTKVSTMSPAYAKGLAQLSRIAKTPIPVLLLGESGTGKEVLARVTHELSGRPGAFVAVNCGAIPPNLVESHLFGHQKGSFSGAVRDEVGFVRAADGGTLFLDEIGDLPPASQAALLRVLQEGEVHPVGAARAIRVDVRVVAATHRALDRMQDEGAFRRDLYARLSGFVMQVPPLRERREDLGQLVGELLERSDTPARLRPEAVARMIQYDWPLNVRELAQCLSTAAALAPDGVIKLEHLPPTIARIEGELTLSSEVDDRGPSPPSSGRLATLSPEDRALREELVRRLAETGFNLSAVARDMGKARQQIQRWVRRFGLKGS